MLGRMFNAVEDVHYCRRISSVLWEDKISTVEDIQYYGGIPSVMWRKIITVGGYHEYCREIPLVLCRGLLAHRDIGKFPDGPLNTACWWALLSFSHHH